jgi:hypothetical protein
LAAFLFRPGCPIALLAALLPSAATSIMASPVMAQSGSSSSAILSAEETRLCICLDDEITRIRGTAEAEYKRLDALIEQARPNVDPYDQAEVDAFKRLYQRREELRRQMQQSGLSRLARKYNDQCAHRKMLKMNVDAVRANPQCPAL